MKKIVIFVLSFSMIFCQPYMFVNAENNIDISDFSDSLQQLVSKYSPGILADDNQNVSLNRIIVKTDSNEPLPDYYGAVAKVEGYDGIHILQYETEKESQEAYDAICERNVGFVEYDYLLEIESDEKGESIVESSTGFLSWSSQAVKVDAAFDYINALGIPLKEITVAVFDTGLDSQHPLFLPKTEYEESRIKDSKWIFKDSTGEYSSLEDNFQNSHGTHVAGIVFDNTLNNVKISPYKIIRKNDELPYSVLSIALLKAIANNVDVINMSLRRTPFDDDRDNFLIEHIIKRAISKNIVIVAAVGNDSKDANDYLPCKYPEVLAVSACDENFYEASFSNFGSCVDISAPGVNIISAASIETINKYPNNFNVVREGYVLKSGTSMAAPLVSAAVALVKSVCPGYTPQEIEQIIKETAFTSAYWDSSYGAGVINFYDMIKKAVEEAKVKVKITDKKFSIDTSIIHDSIYYTLDGSEPTPENGVLYTEPLDLSKKVINVIKAASFMGDAQVGETTVYRMTSFKDMKINRGETEKAVSDSYRGKIRWRSDNLAVATVDSEGNVTGVSEGKTNVVATLESGKRIIFNVTVKEQPLYWLIELFDFWLSLFGINI